MSMGLFKRTCHVRKYIPQTITDGYTNSQWKDIMVKLNVQPFSSYELMALPEGDRTVKRLKSFGSDKLTSADEFTGAPGDRLFYQDHWYECVSSVCWDHTILKHYQSEYVICPVHEHEPPPDGVNVS